MDDEPHTERTRSTTTRAIAVPGGTVLARTLGSTTAGIPLVVLTHLAANLDSFDPELVQPLAEHGGVVLLGYRGVGGAGGRARDSIEDMATDALAAIRALGLDRIDLFGLSMGGMVAQEIVERAPGLVEHLVLAGSGPAGGPGLARMTGVVVRTILRGLVTATDPTTLLFFTRTPVGRRAAADYRARLTRPRADRDRAISPAVFRAQLRAVRRWGDRPLVSTPSGFTGPALLVHGDSDRMVSVANVDVLRDRFPHASVRIVPDAGHGVVSQDRTAVVDAVRDLLGQ